MWRSTEGGKPPKPGGGSFFSGVAQPNINPELKDYYLSFWESPVSCEKLGDMKNPKPDIWEIKLKFRRWLGGTQEGSRNDNS